MKIRLFNLFLVGQMILLLLCSAKPTDADTYPNRVSLAISGGASKGAYEAGLIWGLVEVLRHVERTGAWAVGGEPRPIELSSIAGTSAGGINSLLAALVWSVNPENEGGFNNRIDDNIFRDVWLSTDVNQLLPSDPDSPQYLPDDALLSRKGLVSVAGELRKKWRRPGTFRPGLRVPLGFTVTRVRPETMYVSGIQVMNQRFHVAFELRTLADGSVKFFFDPHDYSSLDDPAMILMPWSADDPPFSITDQQVEDVLLTTSAVPIGFGRKRLQYCRKEVMSRAGDTTAPPVVETADSDCCELECPDGYELAEAEFADGGLFDNLPIGLARLLSESSPMHNEEPLPVSYIYLDPDRERYESSVREEERACEGENPPEACRELTFDLASEAVVLGGAIGTARKYELFRELTGDNWNLNLSQLCRRVADILDTKALDMERYSVLPYFDRQLGCSDRLRYAARLLEMAYSYRITPIMPPLSGQALLREGIATTCRPASDGAEQGAVSECTIDATRLRKELADALVGLCIEVLPDEEDLQQDIRHSALSMDSDRLIHVTSRGAPITGLLLGSFGAFLDHNFREFDYLVGIYDAIMAVTRNQCERNFPYQAQKARACRDKLSEQLYHFLGVNNHPKARYIFALMAKQEFGEEGGLRYAYDPMPPEERNMRIIYEGLNRPVVAPGEDREKLDAILSTEREFFKYLKAEGFEPTIPPEGGKPLLSLIMDDPEYWAHELVNRGTNRLVHLEKLAEAIYRAREPDPEKQDKANTELMGAGALALRTATYKYPKFAFSPSTAPESWVWRNIIPYEAAFDFVGGDMLLFWQPTWNFKTTNAGIRLGLGFTGGILSSDAAVHRENYGILGLDLTRIVNMGIFSGWGVTPAVYHNWSEPAIGEQTSLGFDVHAGLFENRVRISLGARDVIDNADDTAFLTIGIADLPGLTYWLSR